MELWKVKIQYRNPSGKEPVRERTSYAAVHGTFGSDQAQKAGDLVLEAVVGAKDHWTTWQAFVLSAEYVGSVAIEAEKPRVTKTIKKKKCNFWYDGQIKPHCFMFACGWSQVSEPVKGDPCPKCKKPLNKVL